MMLQKTVSFMDIENLNDWFDFYFNKIHADLDKNIMDFSIHKWFFSLKELTSEDLLNGVKNLSLVIQKNQEDGVIQFPITSRIFRNLCKQNFSM